MADSQYKLKDCDSMHKICINSNQIKYQLSEGGVIPLLPKNLSATDTHWQREN